MDGQATACWISPCRCNVARPSTCWQDEANWIASPQQHLGDIIFSSSTGRSFFCPGNKGLHLWLLRHRLGSRFHWRPCDQDSGQVHSRSPRAVERSTSCLPACRPATLQRFLTAACAPPFGIPAPSLSIPGQRHGLGPDPSRHAPSSKRRTTSTSVGLNLDTSQLSKICPSRRNIIFMVNDALLPQVAATKSIRPLWGNPVPRTERHRPSFCSGFASPSSCPSARPSRWQQS